MLRGDLDQLDDAISDEVEQMVDSSVYVSGLMVHSSGFRHVDTHHVVLVHQGGGNLRIA